MTLVEREGLSAVLKIYLDESGTHDGSPVVAVGAYVGRPREWQAWTKKWNVAKRPIEIFHATDAQSLHGEFEGWSESDRDDLVKRLLPVIVDANFPGIVIGIHMDAFREALQGPNDLTSIFGTPYGACFQWLIQSVMYVQARAGNQERIVFVHEGNDHQTEALQSFNHIERYGNPQGIAIEILFGDKRSYPPLQAADILAYEGNRRMRDPDRPERRPWKILNPDRRILAAHYGRDQMPDLISRLEKIRDGRTNEIDIGGGWMKFLTAGFARARSG